MQELSTSFKSVQYSFVFKIVKVKVGLSGFITFIVLVFRVTLSVIILLTGIIFDRLYRLKKLALRYNSVSSIETLTDTYLLNVVRISCGNK